MLTNDANLLTAEVGTLNTRWNCLHNIFELYYTQKKT